MTIRELTKNDIDACVSIFKVNQPIEGWESYPVSRLVFELNAMFEENTFCRPNYIVCEIDNKVVGFAGYGQLGFDDGAYGLFWIQVHPDYQKLGVGKMLTNFRIDAIKKAGGELIMATTRKEWHLERFGFERVSYRGGGYYLMKLQFEEDGI